MQLATAHERSTTAQRSDSAARPALLRATLRLPRRRFRPGLSRGRPYRTRSQVSRLNCLRSKRRVLGVRRIDRRHRSTPRSWRQEAGAGHGVWHHPEKCPRARKRCRDNQFQELPPIRRPMLSRTSGVRVESKNPMLVPPKQSNCNQWSTQPVDGPELTACLYQFEQGNPPGSEQ